MENLDNKLLIDAYFNALEIKIDRDFLVLLENEIINRGIHLSEFKNYEKTPKNGTREGEENV